MPTFADKSREQLKARASAAAAAGYNQLDDSALPSQFALRTKKFALARKKVDAAEVIQRRYRSYVNMWRHYGPSAFVGRQPDQIANFGKCFFPCVALGGIIEPIRERELLAGSSRKSPD